MKDITDIVVTSTTNITPNLGNSNYYYPYQTTTGDFNYTYTYYWPQYIYLYQIRCPKRSCKTMNWLQLDKITPCNGCGSKLRAIREEESPDFDIPVT